ncbi:MAG: NAD(P)/FAD-dependent oxidoreductase [Dehalococcoidia bacterium]|nr:NAD(P)/FAD-dependent oxidoreductase [Dehalococcoidia bacterium]
MDLVYDALVVGGGPAGLSAALQLARYNRHVVMFDSGMGRSTYQQINHNYLGFPGGIGIRELRDIARKQAAAYPIAFIDEAVTAAEAREGTFGVTTESGEAFAGRTIVFATGVRDHFPRFPEWQQYIGRSIFWCITCDGYATRGKRIVVLGNDTDAGVTALQFLEFTREITMLTNAPECHMSGEVLAALERHGIEVVVDTLDCVLGHDGIAGALVLGSGRRLPLDFLFSLQGATPNSELAAGVGIAVTASGYILANMDQQTNVPGAFAAGDVTRDLAHQVATAVHEGITAASAANYHLYLPEQRHETFAPKRGRPSEGDGA